MEIKKVVTSGLIATSLMTALSYLVSSKGRNFREPELLPGLLCEEILLEDTSN